MTQEKYTSQIVTARTEWIPGKLFSIVTTRDPAFEFIPGQFARLGLPTDPQADPAPDIWRAYSMVTPPQANELAFYSIVVPDGLFSPRLHDLKVGDTIYIDKTAFGFMTIERFPQGGQLWMLATGTGLSAYLPMLNDPQTWRQFERIILVHGVRQANELTYQDDIARFAQVHAANAQQFVYLPLASRETLPGKPQARITTLIESGELEQLAGASLDPAHARVMLCGNPAMVTDARKILADRGFAPGRRGVAGSLAVENYW
ncbi:ferredoxin--NADP reductase [Advenella mimigardefordensis]|uniref:ferredoxin--NADP(+) reductase n=1 Tax=Advenella mimigardefordensis (strain DSM 17166 / LMG 22922 / DPN7) TaxID=1247726 RepID=W0PGQ7_ADVMD|nr:ferredoxin--NADP reductase [Advenella mimigardefordensis]AHG64490.1 ferredoxin--NADP reductase [Advenella mimigardefordensis DPN7]